MLTQDKNLMHLAQIVRPWRFLLVLGLAGFLLGCTGETAAPPLDPATKNTTKKDMAERNAERKGAMQERKEAMKGMMKKGSGPG
jgi:hypothetical protein